MIYGVTDTGSLFRLDELCTKVEQVGNIGALDADTLACDGRSEISTAWSIPTGAVHTLHRRDLCCPYYGGRESGREMYGIQSSGMELQ